MHKFLVLVLLVSALSLATSVKEWKNFENGKVYSRKMTNEKKDIETSGTHEGPVIEERLLHSHHKDKNRKNNLQQTTEAKPIKSKNAERHHRKSIEEEMHLRPLNERHHKFPNPALLDKTNGFNVQDSKVSRHTFLQQVRRKQNRRRPRGGKRLKRNRSEHKSVEQMENNSEVKPENKIIKNENEPKPDQKKNSSSAKSIQEESMQYMQTKNEGFPVKQTSYW